MNVSCIEYYIIFYDIALPLPLSLSPISLFLSLSLYMSLSLPSSFLSLYIPPLSVSLSLSLSLISNRLYSRYRRGSSRGQQTHVSGGGARPWVHNLSLLASQLPTVGQPILSHSTPRITPDVGCFNKNQAKSQSMKCHLSGTIHKKAKSDFLDLEYIILYVSKTYLQRTD